MTLQKVWNDEKQRWEWTDLSYILGKKDEPDARHGKAVETIQTNVYRITKVKKSILPGKWHVHYWNDGQEWSVAMRPSLRGASPGKKIEIQIDTETDLVVSARLVV